MLELFFWNKTLIPVPLFISCLYWRHLTSTYLPIHKEIKHPQYSACMPILQMYSTNIPLSLPFSVQLVPFLWKNSWEFSGKMKMSMPLFVLFVGRPFWVFLFIIIYLDMFFAPGKHWMGNKNLLSRVLVDRNLPMCTYLLLPLPPVKDFPPLLLRFRLEKFYQW